MHYLRLVKSVSFNNNFFSAAYLISLFLFIVIYCQLCFPCSKAVMYDIKASFPLPPGLCLSTVFTHSCCHFNKQFLLSDLEDTWLKTPAAKTHSKMQWLWWKRQAFDLSFTLGKWGRWKILYLLSIPSSCTEQGHLSKYILTFLRKFVLQTKGFQHICDACPVPIKHHLICSHWNFTSLPLLQDHLPFYPMNLPCWGVFTMSTIPSGVICCQIGFLAVAKMSNLF